MEEIVIWIIQFLFEIMLEAFFWLPFEFTRTRKPYLVIAGILFGLLSVLIRPQHIITLSWLRNINLLLTPFILTYLIQRIERKISTFRNNEEHERTFFDIYLFIFTFALTRFVLAK